MLLFANTIELKAQNGNGNGNGNNGNGTNWLPNNGNVGVGTLQPAYKLDVVGNSKFSDDALFIKNVKIDKDLSAGTIYTQRIRSIIPGDSLIHFGDSSVVIDHINNRIYSSIYSYTNGIQFSKGFSVGAFNDVSAHSSFAMGNYLQTKKGTAGNIIIGSGIVESQGDKYTGNLTTINYPFVNDISNSLMVGFNSILPTFYVGPNETAKADGVGKVGIATKNPQASLDVNGNVRIQSLAGSSQRTVMVDQNGYLSAVTNTSTNTSWLETGNTNATSKFIGTNDWSPLVFKTNNQEKMRITEDGKIKVNTVLTVNDYVSIGTHNVNTAYKLGVCGVIGAKEVVVETGTWCDFVFDEDYILPSFEKRIEQVLEQKHLPNMPTAQQVEASGAEVGTTLKALLQNLEEAYLYMNELNKKIEALEKQNKELNKK